MQSPPLELVLDVLHLGARNLIRDVGEADDDTISEITRGVVRRLPHGELILAAGLAAGSVGFWRHICRPRWARTTPSKTGASTWLD